MNQEEMKKLEGVGSSLNKSLQNERLLIEISGERQ
jgi:hypothetical protein